MFKRIFLIICLVIIITTPTIAGNTYKSESWAIPSGLPEYTVERVVDGDTIVVNRLGKIRYIGVDTPETVHPSKPVEPYGKEASEANKRLVEGKKVKIELDVQERDKYGRILAYVYTDSTFVNAYLVEAGYAKILTIPPNVKYTDTFRVLQSDARNASRGLWTNSTSTFATVQAPIGTKVALQGTIVYITETGSKYHRAGCRYLARSRIPISLSDAKARGYTPCSVCNP